MELSQIGETVTTERAKGLCGYFGFEYLIRRIDSTPEAFKHWVFDGASMTPDDLVAELAHIPHLVEIALKHDLKYAYGEPGNKEERKGRSGIESRSSR